MSSLYFETSAVLNWLLDESRAEDVLASIGNAEVIVTSVLTFTEIDRALIRAERERQLRAGDCQRVRGLLQAARSSWLQMAISTDVLARASRPFPVEPIRTLDAIHLATALEFTAAFPDLRVLSSDKRINDNAEALGIH